MRATPFVGALHTTDRKHLHHAIRTRKVRDLRHRGDFFERNSMKPAYDIANTTALRPTRRGVAAYGLLHDECGMGFIPHD